jgi:N-methylhydantoinase B/oxoprolinase/acetone carboxylase alpha subunit
MEALAPLDGTLLAERRRIPPWGLGGGANGRPGVDRIERGGSLLRKENLKTDPDCQTLEDVICLVFLENHFEEFARQHDEEKLLNIVRRTWKKMSERGHEAALELRLPAGARRIVEKALA